MRIHERNPGLLWAIIVQVRLAPEERIQQTGERLSHLIDRLADFLQDAWEGREGAAEPAALRLSLVMLIATIRDVVVFADTTHYPEVLGLSGEALLAQLTRAFHRLLRLAILD
jgi:hypothetical protein